MIAVKNGVTFSGLSIYVHEYVVGSAVALNSSFRDRGIVSGECALFYDFSLPLIIPMLLYWCFCVYIYMCV